MKSLLKKNAYVVLFIISYALLIIVSIITLITMNDSKHMFEKLTKERLETLSVILAEKIDSSRLEPFQVLSDIYVNENGEIRPVAEYQELVDELKVFCQEHDLVFAYFMRLTTNEDGDEMMQFIVDNEVHYGETLEDCWGGIFDGYQERERDPDQALLGNTVSTDLGSYSPGDENEHLLTSYSPVYHNGSVVAISGVDVSDTELLAINNNIVLVTSLLVTALVLVFVVGMATVILYKRQATKSEAASVAKSEFLSKMSHEIRTPLNGIIGLTRMARENDNVDQIKVHLDNIHYSTIHLTQIINDILDISKIEAGKVRLEIATSDFYDEMARIKSIIEPSVKNKNQKLNFEVDNRIPNDLLMDNVRVRQVIVNLLSNAVKFTPDNGDITFTVSLIERKGDLVNLKFEVIDNGIGISEEKQRVLFEPFEQLDNSLTRKAEGTGLGLSISKQIVELMGGELKVDSKLGFGSNFYFVVWLQVCPNSDLHEKEVDYTNLGEVDLDLTGKTFLLVEDSKINQMIAEDLFRNFGADVDIAENGLEAYNKYYMNPTKYDMIFMDIQMPVMDGYDATIKIRESELENSKTIPIIAMTANVFKEDIQKSLSVGMNGHLGKPFEVDDVKKVIIKTFKLGKKNKTNHK